MKRIFLGAVFLFPLAVALPVQGAIKYWDINGASTGAGGPTPTGTWDTGATANWTTDSTGLSATTTWTASDSAIFSAGSDATGSFTVTIPLSTTVSATAVTLEEGTILLGPGTLDFGAVNGVFDVASGATMNISGTGSGLVTGTAGITKNNAGVLFLGGTESYSAPAGTAFLTINGGTVDFSGDTALGTAPGAANANAVTLNGGTLRYSGTAALTLNVNRGIKVNAPGATIEVTSTAGTGLSLASSATSGVLNGAGLLTKTGPGRFTENTTSTLFTGKYKVLAGSLNVPGDGRFGAVPASPVADYFILDGATAALRDAITSGTSWNANRGITLGAGGGALQQPGAGTTTDSLTYNGIIAGTSGGTLRIEATDAAGGGTSDGIVILGGANTYDGATTIATGMTLRLGASGVIPDTSVVNLVAGAIFDLGGFDETVKSISGLGGTISLGANTLTLNNPASQSFGTSGSGGSITGTGGKIVKNGSGSITLQPNTSTYTGGFTLNNGKVGIQVNAAFGTGTLTINNSPTIGAASASGRAPAVAVTLNGDITFDDSFTAPGVLNAVSVTAGGSGYTSAPTVTISGGGGSGATATATISSGAVTTVAVGSAGSGYTSAPTVSFSGGGGSGAAATATTTTTPGTITWGAAGPWTLASTFNHIITVNSASANYTVTLSGVVGDGSIGFGLTKAGNGILALNGVNTYSGNTQIQAGKVNVNGSSTLGAGALYLSGGTLNSTANRTASTDPIANPIFLTADSAITTTSTAGTVDLNLSHSTIGGGAGTLTFRNDAASGTGVFQPRFSGSGFSFTQPVVINNGSFGTTVLNSYNVFGTSQTFSGQISGSGGYKRNSSTSTGGTTIFTAANTYSGGTVVSVGTLDIQADGGLGAGNVTVNDGATLILEGGSANTYISSSKNLLLNGAAPLVNLAFAGAPNTINALSFDGGATFKAPGTWGSPSSGAQHTSSRFTGTGMFLVSTGPGSTTVVAPSANPSVYGTVIFTATVSGTGPIPTGSVNFKDGGTTIGSGTLASGQATFNPAHLSVLGSPHSITAVYSGDDDHGGSTSIALSQTVTPAPLTVTGLTADKIYDGTTSAVISGSPGIGGVLGGDDVSLSGTAAGAFATRTAGAGKTVNITGLSLGGADAGNYSLNATLSATISAAPLTVTGITANNKPYDGTTNATLVVSNAVLAGVLGSDDVSLATSNASGAFQDPDVADGKTVNISGLTVAGADASNYSLAQPATTADIKLALTVSGTEATDKVYDATTSATIHTNNAVLEGVQGGDDVALVLTNATGAFANKNVAVGKVVYINGLTLSGADAAKYLITQTVTNASITAAGLTVTGLAAQNKVYDGTLAATLTGTPALSGVQGSDDVSLSGSAAGAFVSKTAGTGKTVNVSGLSITGADAGNYTLTQPSLSADIMPATSTTVLTSSENPSGPGTNVTFTATISGAPPTTDSPTGDVVFLANGVPFTTNTLVSGIASASASSLPLGTNTVAAQYAGDANFLGITNSLDQVVKFFVTCSQTNALLGITDNHNGTFMLSFLGTPQAQYYVLASSDLAQPMNAWAVLPGSTNTLTNVSGLWFLTVTNTMPQQFYRSAAVLLCP